jgi:hypothetical protein
MKCRLKSSSAPRGVDPSPLAPVRSFGPIKASQMSSTNPIRGRSRAAGLRGCVFRKSSTSSLIMGGSSSMGNEVISYETRVHCILDFKSRKNPSERSADKTAFHRAERTGAQRDRRQAQRVKRAGANESTPYNHRRKFCRASVSDAGGREDAINRVPRAWPRKS